MSDTPTFADDTRPRIKAINRAINAEEARLRARHPWLRHQDALGAAAFAGSVLAMGLVAWGYVAGALPWWAAIPLMGMPISILHELEHDLIHSLYFKGNDRVQGLMYRVIWWAKLNASPWYRKGVHLKHHKRSGQVEDAEERMIGLGLAPSLYRILIAIHPIFAHSVLRSIKRDDPSFRVMWGIRQSAPQFGLFALGFFGWPLLRLTLWAAPSLAAAAPGWLLPVADGFMVLWIAPNILRQGALALISSYCHYYGDIPENDVFFQNQILDHWALIPLQLFCFNFGSTHIVHHFVVGQPFYLRQMVAGAAKEEMLRQGVRRNDLGIVRRANRWAEAAA